MLRIVSALLVGLFSGFLIYIIFGFVIGPKDVSPLFIMTTFLGGWAVTTYVVLNGASTAGKVWSSGGLLGAGGWLLVGLAMLVYNGRMLAESEAVKDGNPIADSCAIFGALTSMIGIGLTGFIAIPCLIIYFVARRISNEPCSKR
jgi:hypothetical protein